MKDSVRTAVPLCPLFGHLSGGESSRLFRLLVCEKELAQSTEFAADPHTDRGLLTLGATPKK